MKTTLLRVALIGVVQVLLFELLCQLEVRLDWRESTSELAMFAEYGFLALALMWAINSWPASRGVRGRIPFAAFLAMPLFVALYAVTYVYFWHVRPNIGLYQEPGWVSQHPRFQQELRQRMDRNRWTASSLPAQALSQPTGPRH